MDFTSLLYPAKYIPKYLQMHGLKTNSDWEIASSVEKVQLFEFSQIRCINLIVIPW